jgi:hypothetical protein
MGNGARSDKGKLAPNLARERFGARIPLTSTCPKCYKNPSRMCFHCKRAARKPIIMQHDDVNKHFASCPDLASLDEATRAFLLSRGQELRLNPRATLYFEGSALDDTFCLLLSGELVVEIGGKRVGKVPTNQLFGEMAYFIKDKTRMATIRAGSMGAFVLRIVLTEAELSSPRFAGLKMFLGAQAWDTFVSNSQRLV